MCRTVDPPCSRCGIPRTAQLGTLRVVLCCNRRLRCDGGSRDHSRNQLGAEHGEARANAFSVPEWTRLEADRGAVCAGVGTNGVALVEDSSDRRSSATSTAWTSAHARANHAAASQASADWFWPWF
jgi:hypothetical protein